MRFSSKEKINGYCFKWDEESYCYEARGQVCYDDEHDEIPEPKLWEAANKLADKLTKQGHSADVSYSEKGWVEVYID